MLCVHVVLYDDDDGIGFEVSLFKYYVILG